MSEKTILKPKRYMDTEAVEERRIDMAQMFPPHLTKEENENLNKLFENVSDAVQVGPVNGETRKEYMDRIKGLMDTYLKQLGIKLEMITSDMLSDIERENEEKRIAFKALDSLIDELVMGQMPDPSTFRNVTDLVNFNNDKRRRILRNAHDKGIITSDDILEYTNRRIMDMLKIGISEGGNNGNN